MRKLKLWMRVFVVIGMGLAPALSLAQAVNADANSFAAIDQIVHEVLSSTAVPSASIAIVKSGRVAYAQAYGNASLEPLTPARPGMSYSIGSISKQFTAAAILILAEQHKLSLDDPVARFSDFDSC